MKENSNPAPLVNSVNDACVRLNCFRASLYKAISAGKIRTVKFGSRTIIHEEELQRIAKEGW